MQAADSSGDSWQVGSHRFSSRLLVGSGKYADMAQTLAATEASGAEIITVALRRVNLDPSRGASLQSTLDPKRFTYLPNSAGCKTAEEAVRTLMLARELGGWNLVKLEVISDEVMLYPDAAETLTATKMLVNEGFEVMVYTMDDVATALALEDAGASAIMPLASPIGSGHGIRNPQAITEIIARAQVPVLIDAGIGTASDAVQAMEMGCSGVLMNTAIADARDPITMARAMRYAVIAGRQAFLAGRMQRRDTASPSSPVLGKIA